MNDVDSTATCVEEKPMKFQWIRKWKYIFAHFLKIHAEGISWLIFCFGIKWVMDLVILFVLLTYGTMGDEGRFWINLVHYCMCVVFPLIGGLILMYLIASFIEMLIKEEY